MARALATLGGLPLRVNPNEIRWNFKMKTSDMKTMGGKVIQVLGTSLSDITVRGVFGQGRRDLGDKEGWESQIRFREQVDAWAVAAEEGRSKPIRFTYSPRKWDFNVFVKALSAVSLRVDDINPSWEIVLFPVDDGALDIIKGVKDLYIARLADGVGWKQSDYNGPTQAEVDERLGPYGGSVPDYFRDQFAQVFAGDDASSFTSANAAENRL